MQTLVSDFLQSTATKTKPKIIRKFHTIT